MKRCRAHSTGTTRPSHLTSCSTTVRETTCPQSHPSPSSNAHGVTQVRVICQKHHTTPPAREMLSPRSPPASSSSFIFRAEPPFPFRCRYPRLLVMSLAGNMVYAIFVASRHFANDQAFLHGDQTSQFRPYIPRAELSPEYRG